MPGEYLKVLSWNIQKFGAKKLADPNFLKYVCRVIIDSGADLIGIMEVVGWTGTDLKNQLISVLDNISGSAGNWKGEESEMTPSKPHEQYLFLWKSDPVKSLTIKLYGVIGENAFEDLFKSSPIFYDSTTKSFKTAKIDEFWDLIKAKGYLDNDYIVPDAARVRLEADANNLDLGPQFNLPLATKQKIVDVLLSDDVVNFPYSGSRPPFLAELKLAPNDEQMLVTLFHAPGPTGSWPMMACNNLGLIPEIRNTPKAIVMGDFNVKHNQYSSQYNLYNIDNAGQPVLVQNNGVTLTSLPFQRLTGPAIANFIGMPLGQAFYTKVLANHPTSLTPTTQAPGTAANNANTSGLRRSTYDNFYCRGQLTYQNNKVVPLIGEMVPAPSNTTTFAPFSLSRATLAVLVFNTWWDQQNARGVKKPDIINPFKVGSDTIKKIDHTNPLQSLREAHYIYKYAISDHLPIYMEYEYE